MNRSLLGKIGRHLGHRAAGIRSGVLTLSACGLLTAGAFDYSTWAGMVTAGVSLLILDWLWSAEKTASR